MKDFTNPTQVHFSSPAYTVPRLDTINFSEIITVSSVAVLGFFDLGAKPMPL